MANKVQLSFTEITRRLKRMSLPEVDLVVGIATGGTVPACLVAYELDAPLTLAQVRFRDPSNAPQHAAPVVVAPPVVDASQRRILLVDDVSVSGQTLAAVKKLLSDYEVTTLVMKGSADYVVFPEIESCVAWPWHVQQEAIMP